MYFEAKTYLKSSDRTEVEQMSTPLPAMAVKLPPTKPVMKRTTACQSPKSGMVSNVLRLCCLVGKCLFCYLFNSFIESISCHK